MVKNNFSKTIGGKLFKKWDRQISVCLGFANGKGELALPADFKDHCRGGRSLKRLKEMCDDRDGLTVTPHKELKAIKAQNIRDYANQIADQERRGVEEPIESYHVNGNNNNLEAFANALIQPRD